MISSAEAGELIRVVWPSTLLGRFRAEVGHHRPGSGGHNLVKNGGGLTACEMHQWFVFQEIQAAVDQRFPAETYWRPALDAVTALYARLRPEGLLDAQSLLACRWVLLPPDGSWRLVWSDSAASAGLLWRVGGVLVGLQLPPAAMQRVQIELGGTRP